MILLRPERIDRLQFDDTGDTALELGSHRRLVHRRLVDQLGRVLIERHPARAGRVTRRRSLFAAVERRLDKVAVHAADVELRRLSGIANRGDTGNASERVGNGLVGQRTERAGVDKVGNRIGRPLGVDGAENTGPHADRHDLFHDLVVLGNCDARHDRYTR